MSQDWISWLWMRETRASILERGLKVVGSRSGDGRRSSWIASLSQSSVA